jgi:hypothetical protein
MYHNFKWEIEREKHLENVFYYVKSGCPVKKRPLLLGSMAERLYVSNKVPRCNQAKQILRFTSPFLVTEAQTPHH